MKDYPAFLVTILDDEDERGRRRRILATRQVFATEADARKHYQGLPRSRRPQVLPCFAGLAIVRR